MRWLSHLRRLLLDRCFLLLEGLPTAALPHLVRGCWSDITHLILSMPLLFLSSGNRWVHPNASASLSTLTDFSSLF